MAQKNEHVHICDTYITDTNDLFVLILKENTYSLYMLDLDQANSREQQELSSKSRYCFQIQDPVLTYTKKDVQNERFVSMHIRGSSRKEIVQLNEILIVFL